ncbi:MAG: hypothetical protein Q9223_004670, partial [Gallowayella weberi]
MVKPAHATGAARPTIASASRNAQSGGLSKPPVTTPKARPLVSSAANSTKPRTGTPGRIGSDAENRQLSSIERSRSTSPIKSSLENKRLLSTERSRSTSPIKSSLKPELTQSTPHPSSTTSKKTRSQSISPTKAANVGTPPVRTSISNGRPASSLTTTTTTKPALTGSVRGRQTVVVASRAVASDTPKNIRPSLGARKSTTIQQRLRELSLVNDMLRAAKGEDEAEDNEVEEDHGKQIGTTFAASRIKQKKAKYIEDLVSSDQHSAIEASTREHVDSSVAGEDIEPTELSTSAELPSQSPESTIKAHLTDTAELLTERLQNLQVSHENKHLELRQLSEAKDNIEAKYLELQSSKEREMHHYQETIEELRANLKQTTQAKEDAARSSQQAVESLEAENQQVKAWGKVLEDRLQQSNESTRRDGERIESLETENKQVKAWEKVLEARLQQANESTGREAKRVESLEAENKQIKAWEKVLEARLQQSNESTRREAMRIESLEAENKQVKAWEKVLEARLQRSNESIEREVNSHHEAIQVFERKIQEHEAARLKAAEEHSREVSALSRDLDAAQRSKQTEALNQEKVRAELQDRIKLLHETNEREIHTIKCSLASEHEAVVSKLSLKLDGALGKGHEVSDHQDMVVKLKSQMNQLRATLGIVHASNTELRQALTDAEQQHKKEISELDRALEDSKAKVTCLETEVTAQGPEKITGLEPAKKATDTAFERQLENVAGLHQRLEQSQDAPHSLPRFSRAAVEWPRLHNRNSESPSKGEMHDALGLRIEPLTCKSWCGESGTWSSSSTQHWSTADSSVSGMSRQGDESVEDQKSGSHIQEQMIDMQKQLRQIGDMNDDILQQDK